MHQKGDGLGNRMKEYEVVEAGRRLMQGLPVCVRLDGKCFSAFTRGLRRPFDERLTTLMRETTRYLMAESAAVAGYTQSDEISLLFYTEGPKSQAFLDRRVQKLTSILAAMATAYFNRQLAELLPEKAGKMPIFDCRVWSVPSKEEAANTFYWRELDATKNSISMAAQSVYSHTQLHGKGSADKQEMLFQKGINWNDYPSAFKRGTWLLRRAITRSFTTSELAALPPKHAARANPDLLVERHEIVIVDMPSFGKVINRVGVLFDGEEPRVS